VIVKLGGVSAWRFVGVAGATVGLVAALGIARPAAACAGCGVTMTEFVHEVSAFFVATSDGSIAPNTYRLKVGPVLVGTVPAGVTYRGIPGSPAMPRGSRWIIAIYPVDRAAFRTGVLDGRWDAAWSVAPNGRIELGQVIAPPTLTGLLAWFGLPATDTETVPAPARSGLPPLAILVLTLAVFSLSYLALAVRLRGSRAPADEAAPYEPFVEV